MKRAERLRTATDGPRPVALVTDAELLSALAIIRSLGRAGWQVVAASRFPKAPGLHSRYTTWPVVLPTGVRDERESASQHLLDTVSRYGVDVLIPVTDQTLLALDPVRTRLPAACTVATAEAAAVRLTQDKVATLALAERLGVPVPDHIVVTSAKDARGLGAKLGWPVVVKPQFSRLALPDGTIARCSTRYARDPEELSAVLGAQPRGSTTLLQRYHHGAAYSICLLTQEGQPLSEFSHRRLREVPPSGGVSALRESVPPDPLLEDYAQRLLLGLRCSGLAMVEFKVEAGRPLLMEINGRIWGSRPLATRSGMDFPRQLAELFRDGTPHGSRRLEPLNIDYRTGVRSRQLRLELQWIEDVLRQSEQSPAGPPIPRRTAVTAAFGLLRPDIGYDGVAVDDLRPAWMDLLETVRQYRERLRRWCPKTPTRLFSRRHVSP